MAFLVKTEIKGLEQLLSRLQQLPVKVQTRVLRPAVTQASTILVKGVRARVPVEVGGKGTLAKARSKLLKKSIGRKIKIYRRRMVVVAVVGARQGFKKQIGVRQRGPNKGQPIFYNPSKTFHLVELGHGGRAPAPPHPSLRTALAETAKDVQETLRRKLLEGIEKEA